MRSIRGVPRLTGVKAERGEGKLVEGEQEKMVVMGCCPSPTHGSSIAKMSFFGVANELSSASSSPSSSCIGGKVNKGEKEGESCGENGKKSASFTKNRKQTKNVR